MIIQGGVPTGLRSRVLGPTSLQKRLSRITSWPFIRFTKLIPKAVTSLSDMIAFESDVQPRGRPTGIAGLDLLPDTSEGGDPTLRAQEILSRASKALAAAKELIGPDSSANLEAGQPSAAEGIKASPSSSLTATRSVLRASLEGGSGGASSPTLSRPAATTQPSTDQRSSGGGPTAGSGDPSSKPAWADAMFGGSSTSAGSSSSSPLLQLKSQAQATQAPQLDFAEPVFKPMAFLDLTSQEAQDLLQARSSTLPPLQSVLELTTASRPPSRQSEATEATMTAPTVNSQMLKDGSGMLGDGTRWQKRSGEEFGADGYWKRWTQLVGLSQDGTVSWEECWWESSDYKGLRELGAAKKGTAADGSAWNEAWSEKMYHDLMTNEKMVERTAHKWARDEMADEWEEQWGEKYSEKGPASKWADKWARQAENVWHERWGENYDGDGGCVKYTDKWAERLGGEGEAPEQWGDKWTESFKAGMGSKHGEVWSAGRHGERYNRYWNEEHYGSGHVRKYGNSTSGDNWDYVEQMDTYYNPIPHFGYDLAVKHSPDLVNIPLRRPNQGPGKAKPAPEEEDVGGLGGGMDDL